MTRQRLRPAYSDAELQRLYRRPHDHRRWPDHRLRVTATVDVARWMLHPRIDEVPAAAGRAADLSCGNGAILNAVPAAVRYFGDFAPGWEYTGPIEQTISELPRDVDLFICSETIEHLHDPDGVLKQIRGRARTLVLSTPVDAFDDPNPEHYWAWSRDDVEQMLTAAGFTTQVYTAVDFRPHSGPYCFGIWGVR